MKLPCRTVDEAMAWVEQYWADQARRFQTDMLSRDGLDVDDLDDLLAEQAAEQRIRLTAMRAELVAWLASARDQRERSRADG